ncbi:MAG: hypothetical protein NZM12_08770, partial [Steroidobacteraceae bacterium]|nr:hypothetical protein [Steroidobacteraceae bacterium]
MRRGLLFAVCVWLSPVGLHAGTRVITHEDLWLMPRVGAPIPAPDGTSLLVNVLEPAYNEQEQRSDLWLVRADGRAAPRRLTHTPGRETGVSWAPNGRRILFSAKRGDDEVEQLYLLDLDGGEAQRLTGLVGGARNAQFAPDGRAIAFETSAWAGTRTEDENREVHAQRKSRKFNTRVYSRFPIRSWDRWLDERQVRLLVLSLSPAASSPRDLLAGTRLLAEPGFSGRVTDSGESLEFVWAPDSRSLVFVASTDSDRAAYAFTTTALFEVPVTGGEPRRLTPVGDASYSRPEFAPDGRTLFALREPVSSYVYNLTEVAALPWLDSRNGGWRTVTRAFDRSVTSFALTPDSRWVYLLAEEAGHEKLFRVDARGGAPQRVFDMTRGVYTNLRSAPRARQPVLFANYESASQPPEVVRIDPAASGHRVLTAFASERAASLDLPAPEPFWMTSSRGRRIHNFLVRPPGFDPARRYPLFVVIHGGPH